MYRAVSEKVSWMSSHSMASLQLRDSISKCISLLPLVQECLLSRSYASKPLLDTSSADSNDEHLDRRWREMERYRPMESGNPRLPSLRLVRNNLHLAKSPCSQPTPTTRESLIETPQNWREIVRLARQQQQTISGNQMLTDTFGRKHTYLRISLTERCNLRCLYCMPEDGVDLTPNNDLLSSTEIARLAELFVDSGVTKIRLTGGEPTLRPDLLSIVSSLSQLQGLDSIGLTSNGLTLGKKLADLKAAGLTHLNISLDTLRPDRFQEMTRRSSEGHRRVMDSIYHAIELGFQPVKLNVVVMKGVNDDEIADFVALTKDAPINVRFIEYMPFDGNVWKDTKMVPYKDMLAAIQAKYGALERCRDPRGEVAKNFKLPDHVGEVSFVTSMTSAFCGDCNRLRLMADGNLKVCLFGANEISLRDAMREGADNEDLVAVVSAAVDRKKAAHAGMFELARSKNRAMVKIGG